MGADDRHKQLKEPSATGGSAQNALNSQNDAVKPEQQHSKAKGHIEKCFDWLAKRYAPSWWSDLNQGEKVQALGAAAALLAALLYAVFAFFTLMAILWQAVIARQATQTTQRSFALGERPYISIGREDGTVAEIVNETKKPNAMIELYFRNAGQLPALDVDFYFLALAISRVTAGTLYPPHKKGNGGIARYRTPNGGVVTEGEGITIAGGATHVELFSDAIPKAALNQIRDSRTAVLMVNGVVAYCDPFGHYTCTNYQMFYDPSVNRFSVVNETDCTAMYHFPDRLRSKGTPLPPCEQPSERAHEYDAFLKQFSKGIPPTPPSPPTP